MDIPSKSCGATKSGREKGGREWKREREREKKDFTTNPSGRILSVYY